MGKSSQELSLQSDYVHVERRRGYEVSIEEQAELLQELAQYCDEVDCRKGLILGESTKVDLGPLDIYELGKEIAKYDLQIVVAGNRGGPGQFFADQDEARAWLRVN